MRPVVAVATLLLSSSWIVATASNAVAGTADTTVSFTSPGCSDYTVPAGIAQVSIVAIGQAGSSGTTLPDATGGAGGAGDEASGTLAVTPGDVLDVCVAYGGGTGGVGAGQAGGTNAGAGGGASGVLDTDVAEYGAYPYLVAGGGGGGSNGGTDEAAGLPGGSAGQDGVNSPGDSDGGLGGGQAGNGNAPALPTFIQAGGTGASNPGTLNPQFDTVSAYAQSGGGGGGGYVAGLGGSLGAVGAGGGGGGESSCGLGLGSDCQIAPRIGTSTTVGTGANQPHVSLDLSSEVSSGGFSISSPIPGEVFYQDAPVTETFTCASDNYACADQNGQPSGSLLDTSTLGSHTLVVSCFPTTACTGYTSVTYTVVAATGTPTVSIANDGQYYLQGSAQTEQFSCADPDGPGIKSCVDSSGNPSGAALDTSTVSDPTITVTATTYDGRTTTVSATYHVIGINITTPAAGSTIAATPTIMGYGLQLNFACSGTGVAYCELASANGEALGTPDGGEVLLGYGVNTLVFSAKNASDQVIASKTITVNLAGQPTISVTTPTSGAYYQALAGDVQASFTCSDGEGGPGIASCTDQYGHPGSGPDATDLNDVTVPGTYTLNVTATSQDGLSDQTSVTYHVVTPPDVTFTAPSPYVDVPDGVAGYYAQGQQVTAEFTCVDSAGGPGIVAGTCLDQNGNPSGVSTVDTSTTGHHEFEVCSTSLDGLSGCQSADYYVVPAAAISWPQQGPYPLADTPATLDAAPADGSTTYQDTYSVVSGPCSLSNDNQGVNDQLSFSGTGSCVIGVQLDEFDFFGDVTSAGYAQQTITAAGKLLVSAAPSHAAVDTGQEVSFTGSASGGAGPYTYAWDFGDGPTGSTTQNPTHTYSAAGTYTVTLTVTDATGTSSTASFTETVDAAPSASTADSPTSSDVGQPVAFSGAASSGSGGYSYDWDFGDGSTDSTAQNPTHTYSDPGTYQVVLTVTDSQGGTATSTLTETVDPALTATASASTATPDLNQPVSFTGSASGGSGTYTYRWAFGDASSPSSKQDPTHSYPAIGSYSVTLTVADGNGDSVTETLTETVAGPPAAPTINTVRPGDASATITFTAPDDGGSPITGYTVTATDNTTPANGGQTATGTTSPITVTVLTNGDSYIFTVTATNAVGTGPASAPSTSVVPATPVSLRFTGALTYTDSGTITSGQITTKPATGTLNSAAGTITIPGAKGGTTTITIQVTRVFGSYIGNIRVSDPSEHLNTTAVILTTKLTRTATGQLTGTATGLNGFRVYTLYFTI
jgi:PKD repeat protein